MNLPPVASTILYQGALYQVKRRSRHIDTHAITLWLCHCSDTHCQHTKTSAPLEEVTQLPQKGDRICNFSTRKPYTLKAYRLDGFKVLMEVVDDNNVIETLPLTTFDLLPEVGDRVVIAAKPYCNWIREKAKAIRGHEQHPPWQHRQLIASLDDLAWMSSVFEVRAVKDGVAILARDNQRLELPIDCLRVLEKCAAQAEFSGQILCPETFLVQERVAA